jgi:hypothetical protein
VEKPVEKQLLKSRTWKDSIKIEFRGIVMKWEMGVTVSGSCPVVNVGIVGGEPFGFYH